MMACLDVHYGDGKATAAAIVFPDWHSGSPVTEYTVIVPEAAQYEPGRFYLRELLPLRAVIDKIAQPIDVYVIDAYCHLTSGFAPGLGVHVHEAIHRSASIVGVAKNRYRDTTHAIELLRGRSKRPLFVTSIGIEYAAAAQHVASMAGKYRIPMLMKAADRLSRRQLESEPPHPAAEAVVNKESSPPAE